MQNFFQTLIANRYTLTAAILFTFGFCNMLIQQNLIKKVIAFDIMDSSTFLFLATRGYIEGRTAAILNDGGANVAQYVNPIPAGLVLTGIVVSVSVSAFSLALIQKIYMKYGTIELPALLEATKKDREESK